MINSVLLLSGPSTSGYPASVLLHFCALPSWRTDFPSSSVGWYSCLHRTRDVRDTPNTLCDVMEFRFVYGQYLAALKTEREAERARARENERIPDESPQPREDGDVMEDGRVREARVMLIWVDTYRLGQ